MLFSTSLATTATRSSLPTVCRTYSSLSKSSALPPLPPANTWRKLFPPSAVSRRERVSLKNPHTAQRFANALFKDSTNHSQGKVVIEAHPGPGVLSRALLQLPSTSVRKLIILEDDELYLKYLRPLQEADPRVTVVPTSGHSWDSYAYLEDHGLLKDVEAAPWESGSFPNLHFVTHLPHSVRGEQLLAQLFRSIPERSWLFRYGRVPMSVLMSEYVWNRLYAPPGESRRCKLSVIGEATADIHQTIPAELMAPYEENFFPPVLKASSQNRRVGQPLHAMTAIPYAEQVIQRGLTDEWDYCLRRMFVLKSTKVEAALPSIGPGAKNLLDAITSSTLPREQRVTITKKVRDLNISDWALIMRAFTNWPFKPTDLLVSDAFSSDDP